MRNTDVIIVGAGAAGLMCAIEAGRRGRRVVVLEKNRDIGEKIRISGGGRCNFTNLETEPSRFISANRHFCTSALARFSPADVVRMVERHGIRYHEKKLGQLFCDGSSRQIITMLVAECRQAGVEIVTGCTVGSVRRDGGFSLETSAGAWKAPSLVIATGGRSVPRLGASPFGYELARQFGLEVVPPRPGLVPLVIEHDFADFAQLAGVSADACVRLREAEFRENILFTHHGLSGPAILQISSYWKEGDTVEIGLVSASADLPADGDGLRISLRELLPRRLADVWHARIGGGRSRVTDLVPWWRVTPSRTQGWDKAEVTVGGIDTRGLSSKTMEARNVPGLYCVGEVVDVTGWLGGYNFQWAWASGWAAGRYC